MSLIPHMFIDDGKGKCADRVSAGAGGYYRRTCGRDALLHETQGLDLSEVDNILDISVDRQQYSEKKG